MNTANERVKAVRKHFGLTMEEFGAKLGVSRASISNIENGNRNLTSQMATAICNVFGVSEDWLKNEKGPMVLRTPADDVAKFAAEHDLDVMEETLIREYLLLSESDRAVFRRYLSRVLADLNEEAAAAQELDIDAEVEEYRAELIAEAASKKYGASDTTEENMA